MNRKLAELISVALDEASLDAEHLLDHRNPACKPLLEALKLTLGSTMYDAWYRSGGALNLDQLEELSPGGALDLDQSEISPFESKD